MEEVSGEFGTLDWMDGWIMWCGFWIRMGKLGFERKKHLLFGSIIEVYEILCMHRFLLGFLWGRLSNWGSI